MAENVSARQTYVAMDIPKDKVGLIIGRKGWRLQEIKERSGAHVEIVDDKVHLLGTPEQCERAKNHIEEILNPVSVGGPLFGEVGNALFKKKFGLLGRD